MNAPAKRLSPGERGRNALQSVAARLDDALGSDDYQIENDPSKVDFVVENGKIVGAWVPVRVFDRASAS